MGLFKAAREHMNPTPVDVDRLRADLRRCIDEIGPTDAKKFLSWFSKWGGALEDVASSEAFLAATPVLALEGRGLLGLTSSRLLFSGEFGRLEIPAHRLSIPGISVDRRSTRLNVAVAPNNDPVHEFGISTLQAVTREHFVGVLETFVRETETAGVRKDAPLSVADELAKFARLREQGIITTDEFEAKKAQLLSP